MQVRSTINDSKMTDKYIKLLFNYPLRHGKTFKFHFFRELFNIFKKQVCIYVICIKFHRCFFIITVRMK